MAVENPKSITLELAESNKVIVVGAGPVGLVASLFLSKYHVSHMLVEQLAEPDNNPQAHFINKFYAIQTSWYSFSRNNLVKATILKTIKVRRQPIKRDGII